MYRYTIFAFLFLLFPLLVVAQEAITDDFEGNGNITTWSGDDCAINTSFSNPVPQGINTSSGVLRYEDTGGEFANIRFDLAESLDLSESYIFTLKVFIPSSGLTGNQPNQISLKLQNGNLAEPWSSQTEIIHPLALDTWQEVSFDFANGNYINLNGGSPPPTQRADFNRVLIQINGEGNSDHVLAYIDDFYYDNNRLPSPVFDYLVWADEFDQNGPLDASKWFHQTQLPQGGSWYNGEIQHYTNRLDNSYVEDGIMHLVAKRENFTDQGETKQFTSARLNSTFAFTYGRVEVRAKLPTGVGTWPAIWTLGQNINEDGAYWDNLGFDTTPWPACGEMDIMEHWGRDQNHVQSATHTPSSFGNTVNKGGQIIPTVSTDFHVYTLEWTPERLIFSVDGNRHFIYNPPIKDAATWPFDAPQYLLLNIAIEPSIEASFTQGTMEIDYVRVYQANPVATQERVKETLPVYYPNPVSNQLTILVGAQQQDAVLVQISNPSGQLLKSATYPVYDGQLQINDLDDLTNGTYLISYGSAGRTRTVKMIKQ